MTVATEPTVREYVEAVLSHPSIAPWFEDFTIGGKPWREAYDDLMWIPWEGGVFAVEVNEEWEARFHVAVLPMYRGKPAIEEARRIVKWMFLNTPCKRIGGLTPKHNRLAQRWNVAVGLKRDGEEEGCIKYVIDKDDGRWLSW